MEEEEVAARLEQPKPQPGGGSDQQNVRVVVRIRPLSSNKLSEHGSKEKREQSKESITAGKDGGTVFVDKNLKHDFDAVLGPNSDQGTVYEKTAGDTVRSNIFRGFNVTILAYGQTGSGKTFSMGTNGGEAAASTAAVSTAAAAGEENGKDAANAPPTSLGVKNAEEGDEDVVEEEPPLVPPSASDGIIPRAVYDLFLRRSKMKAGRSRVRIEMSYLEIYNEEARDLLSSDDKLLQIRDSRTEGVVVQGLSTRPVRSPRDVQDLMDWASEKRAVASTAMNAVSSRSHAICTLHITIAPLSTSSPSGDAADETASGIEQESHDEIKSKLTLVDLAGSERIKRTGAEGARMKEGININKGLFVLGQVVSALSELGQESGVSGSNHAAHIPYRDSKLTRLLQDSLGGNSKTVMLACVSSADSNVDESINTLRYATRVRNIKNSAVRNVVAAGLSAAEAEVLRKENRELKAELVKAKQMLAGGSGGGATGAAAGPTRVAKGGPTPPGDAGDALVDSAVVTKLRAKCATLSSTVEQMTERVQLSADDALKASMEADRWQLRCERIEAKARENGIPIVDEDSSESKGGDSGDIGAARGTSDNGGVDGEGEGTDEGKIKGKNVGREDLVTQLRRQAAELTSELREARADAAVARATAAAVVAGGGNLSAAEEMALAISLTDEEGNSDETEEGGIDRVGNGQAVSEELTKELVEMSGKIEEKEAMAARMNRERECMETLQTHMEGAMKKLQEEADTLTSERESLLVQVEQQSLAPPNGSINNKGRKGSKAASRAEDPAKKKLKERIAELERRIMDLKRKAAEHAKGIRMKEQAEKKCAQLAEEIAGDKRCRAELQKKLKESSAERRAEKKAAQKEAVKMMRDRQKLQRELNKVKDAAAKQAQVLKRKAAEALRKQKRDADMQKKRQSVASIRAASGLDAVKEERKGELESWIQREVDAALALNIIRGKMDEQGVLLEEAMARKEQLLSPRRKRHSDESDSSDLQALGSEIKSRERLIGELEADIDEVRKVALGGKLHVAAASTIVNFAFVDNTTWQGLTQPEVRFVASSVFDLVVDANREVEDMRTKEDSAITAAVRKAVSEEKRKAEASMAELKLQHSETVISLLESTKGAMEHKVRTDLLASADDVGAGLDSSTKSDIDNMLDSFLSRCDQVRDTVKDELQKVHSQQEDQLTLQAQVFKDLVAVPKSAKRKPKEKKKRKSISDDERDFIFEEEEDDGKLYDSDDSDWNPDTPANAPRKGVVDSKEWLKLVYSVNGWS